MHIFDAAIATNLMCRPGRRPPPSHTTEASGVGRLAVVVVATGILVTALDALAQQASASTADQVARVGDTRPASRPVTLR